MKLHLVFILGFKNTANDFWNLRRIQYRKIVHLVDAVDDAISTIILIAFANNLFFICVQIVRSIKPMPSIMNKVYFWFSLSFLIARTLAVSLYASYIHYESKEPFHALCTIPRYSWCIEAYRFSEEIVNETVALSGMKFFYLTRGLVLTVSSNSYIIQFRNAIWFVNEMEFFLGCRDNCDL